MLRFEREARLLASLSHQNIATLHGLEEHEGQGYLVMELAEGETLAERLQRGSLPADEALEIALQGDPQTEFLIYSRGRGGKWPQEDRTAWVAEIEGRFPQLKGRVFTMKVPVDEDGMGSFRELATGQMIRQRVVELLELDESQPDQR